MTAAPAGGRRAVRPRRRPSSSAARASRLLGVEGHDCVVPAARQQQPPPDSWFRLGSSSARGLDPLLLVLVRWTRPSRRRPTTAPQLVEAVTVTVSARKREEKLQSVPFSVVAPSGQALRNRGRGYLAPAGARYPSRSRSIHALLGQVGPVLRQQSLFEENKVAAMALPDILQQVACALTRRPTRLCPSWAVVRSARRRSRRGGSAPLRDRHAGLAALRGLAESARGLSEHRYGSVPDAPRRWTYGPRGALLPGGRGASSCSADPRLARRRPSRTSTSLNQRIRARLECSLSISGFLGL